MVNIQSISFDEKLVQGWHKGDDTDRGIGFMDNPQAPANVIMTDFNPFPLELPVRLDDLYGIRQVYKKYANSDGCGLIEADVITAAGLKVIRVIEKQKQEPHGMAYKGSLTIPLANAYFVLRAWCFEVGTTGVRDSLLAADFMSQGTFDPTKADWGGWWIDPLGLGPQPVRRNLAEDPKYDAQFPDHPLSRVRNYLSAIENSLHYDQSGGEDPPDEKPPGWFKKVFGKR
jgi:hypothetical protein